MKSLNLLRARRVLAVAAVLAIAAAGWTGWSWLTAARDDGLTRARERDQALNAATTSLIALNTVDYRTVQADYDRWLSVSTGQFGTDLVADREVHLKRAAETKTVATATVRQAALVELVPDERRARLLAVLDVRLATGDGEPVANRGRFDVELVRTDQGWKVSAVQAAG